MGKVDARSYRATVTAALRHLGHAHGNPPTKLVIEKLKPYLRRGLGKSKEARRRALIEAANLAMQSTPKFASQMAERAPVHKERRGKVKRDGFYSSWEWKAARYEALRIHGQRCQCCGWMPGDTKSGRLVVDHIKPRSKYPDLSLDVGNLQVLCNDCNMGKSNVHADDFRGLDSWLASIANET